MNMKHIDVFNNEYVMVFLIGDVKVFKYVVLFSGEMFLSYPLFILKPLA